MDAEEYEFVKGAPLIRVVLPVPIAFISKRLEINTNLPILV